MKPSGAKRSLQNLLKLLLKGPEGRLITERAGKKQSWDLRETKYRAPPSLLTDAEAHYWLLAAALAI